MRLAITGFVLVLLLTGQAGGEFGRGEFDSHSRSPKITETTIDLKIVATLLDTHHELSSDYPEPPERTVTIREFSRGYSKEIAQRFPRKDAWANPFMVVGFEEEIFVVSAGENQIYDTIQFFEKGEESAEERSMAEIFGDDIVLVVGNGVINGAASMRHLQRRTMADLRSLGTAIESFSIDHNVYPVQDRDLLPVELIQHELSPIYIRTAPLVDGWGNEFLMWGTEEEYVVMSLGADGLPDQYYGFVNGDAEAFPFKGATDDPSDDVIFANGQFVQWPRGTQQ